MIKATKGKPSVIIANGCVLNQATGTNDYDTCKAYRVTAEGITEVVE